MIPQTSPTIFFLLLRALAAVGQTTSSVSLDLHWYENFAEEKLQCNDGSAGGFYYRPSTDIAGENKWIFYLQGGGWCWNSTSCADRIDRNGNGHLVSSSQWADVKIYSHGIFNMKDSDWEGAHLVYVPYCSSDAHMGDSEHEIPGYGVQQFRGRRLARKAVEQLVGEREDQVVLFGGTSAGGRGSMVLVDFLQELLHPSTEVRGLHDSGAYQDILPYDSNYYPFGDQCHDAYQMFQPPLSPECLVAQESEPHRCICGEYLLPLVLTPSMVIIHQDDSYQLKNDIGVNPTFWTEEMCHYAESPFRSGMVATLEAVWDRGHVVFGAACYMHGLLTGPDWQTLEVEGVTAESVLLSWLGGERVHAVSSCRGVNCQPGCPRLTPGQHTYC